MSIAFVFLIPLIIQTLFTLHLLGYDLDPVDSKRVLNEGISNYLVNLSSSDPYKEIRCTGFTFYQTYPDPDDCHDFFICSFGTVTRGSCGIVLAYHPTYKTCVHQRYVEACGNVTCEIDGVYPDEMDCKKYYLCINKDYFHISCPIGTTFNRTAESCTFGECETTTQPPTTEATAQPSTEATPQLSTEATPQLSTEATPQPSTEATSQPSTEATPQPSTEATPQPSTEATPQPSTQATPEPTPP